MGGRRPPDRRLRAALRGCCSLLRSHAIDPVEYTDHPEHLLSEYADAYRVRLDVGTGVCVLIDEIGGFAARKGP